MPSRVGRAPLRSALLPALVVLALLAPLAAASGASPPEGATRVDAGRPAAFWLANASAPSLDPATGRVDGMLDSLEPGQAAAIRVAGFMDRDGPNTTAIVWEIRIASADLAFETTNVTLRKEYSEAPPTSEAFHFGAFNFTAPAADGNYSFSLNFTVLSESNGTLTPLGSAQAEGSVLVATVTPPVVAPPPGGIPTLSILVGAAVLVLGGGGAAVVARQRAVRRRMNQAPRRSQVMREMELEQKLEKAKTKDPEQAVVIQQEIRQAEKVREDRRELQILEAKRADALKTMDLLKKRLDAGGLTKHQYENMVAKKRADLERIEAEIAQMRGDDASAAS